MERQTGIDQLAIEVPNSKKVHFASKENYDMLDGAKIQAIGADKMLTMMREE